MRKKRLLALVSSLCMIANIVVVFSYLPLNAEAADIFTADSKNAYVLLDKQAEENNCEFLDGMEMGISDASHLLYNEVSQEAGVNGRKFYAANLLSIKLDEGFCEKGDSEFLVTVVYYDYGPKQGRFFFEYLDETGASHTKTIIKPGNVQRFNAETIYIGNMDAKKQFQETGATFQIRTNGQNLFKKVEVLNLSKFKREGKQIKELGVLPSKNSLTELTSLQIIKEDMAESLSQKIGESTTVSDAVMLLSTISGKSDIALPDGHKNEDFITQGALLDLFLKELELNRGEKSAVDYALEMGVISNEDMFYNDSVFACNYNLIELVYNTLFYVQADDSSMLEKLASNNFFDNDILVSNETLIALTYKTPKKLPYQTITENETGQTYYYMNICGIPTIRTYVTAQSWTSDGKSFVCGFQSGLMFLYNTETQMLTYIDKTLASTQLAAMVGTDDYVYYAKVNDAGEYGIWKADLTKAPVKPEFICNSIDKNSLGLVHLTNDCKYISAEMYAPGNTKESITGRYSVEDKEWVTFKQESFPYSPGRTHDIINPVYPNLVSFCHEINGVNAVYLYDRIWQVDLDTMQAHNVFKQGIRPTGAAIQGATHEIWSVNGEYMYFIAYDMRSYNVDPLGDIPAVVRFDKDGSHRKYYYTNDSILHQNKHCAPSGDDKYVVADGDYVVIISTETWEIFPISRYEWNGQASHPYHGHAVIARNHYKVNWGGQDAYGMLGVKWFDFTELVSSQAKGGHYNIGENVNCASYEDLECETIQLNYRGKNAVKANIGNSVYLDISEELIDTDNGSIKLSFDYFDNGYQPIEITYTSGVNDDNDRYRIFNATKDVRRKNTKQWKHAEIVIESGNFEDIGKFNTDIKISGVSGTVYLSNVKASLPEDK